MLQRHPPTWQDVMPSTPSRSSGADLSQPLSDRVRYRAAEAGLAFDRHLSASRLRPKARNNKATLTPEVRRETQALRRVFHELGESHRKYRRRTGEHITPGLREAARAFKQAPSLASLVAVAVFLDELGLIGW